MSRHHARELALKVLFEHDLAQGNVEHLLARTFDGEDEIDRVFATRLVEGTLTHLSALDEDIQKASIDWKVRRMPTIDRNILRMAAYEMHFDSDVPLSVIINEALELTQSYSTTEAKRFVNGVLGTMAKTVRPEGDQDRP